MKQDCWLCKSFSALLPLIKPRPKFASGWGGLFRKSKENFLHESRNCHRKPLGHRAKVKVWYYKTFNWITNLILVTTDNLPRNLKSLYLKVVIFFGLFKMFIVLSELFNDPSVAFLKSKKWATDRLKWVTSRPFNAQNARNERGEWMYFKNGRGKSQDKEGCYIIRKLYHLQMR